MENMNTHQLDTWLVLRGRAVRCSYLGSVGFNRFRVRTASGHILTVPAIRIQPASEAL